MKSGRNVTLQNMTIVGNFYPTSRAKLAGNQLDHGVEIKGGDGVTVQDSTFRNVFGDAVTTVRSESRRGNATGGVASRNVRVLRNTITTMARQCVSFTELIGGSIEDNSMSDCHYGGIDLEINFGGQKLQDIKVLRNQVHGYTLAGIAVEGAVSAMQVSAIGDMARIEIRGNTVGAGDTCFAPIMLSEKDNERGPISDVTIANNTVLSRSYGIGVFDAVGAWATGNDITLTKPKGHCASSLTTVMPVWVKRSSGVNESGNVSHGY
ncbi:MAG TPA: right-handed parallel beta-helix repeat-containing protein [Solirubrobacteraceae bacterium]|nr:right-handed parallel beta-helix repeat-containing protein [Solirubrobacteraceae bacterium]